MHKNVIHYFLKEEDKSFQGVVIADQQMKNSYEVLSKIYFSHIISTVATFAVTLFSADLCITSLLQPSQRCLPFVLAISVDTSIFFPPIVSSRILQAFKCYTPWTLQVRGIYSGYHDRHREVMFPVSTFQEAKHISFSILRGNLEGKLARVATIYMV